MEQQGQQEPNTKATSGSGSVGNNSGNGGFLCRQSSTRWTPTTDQIRILKELYYNNGVRSPSAEQIQRISARLRQYGKIEGKNVFYWFQNHKARERQKKRFTTIANTNPITTNSSPWKPDHQEYQLFHHVKYSNLSPPVVPSSSSSPANVVGVNGNYQYGYGGVTNNIMEKAFRDGSTAQNFGWVGSSDPYSSTYSLVDKRSFINVEDDDHDHEDYHDGDEASPEIETLPLFPMRGEDDDGYGNVMIKPNFSDSGAGGYYGHVSSRASLELSLNSYGYISPNSL